MSFLGLVGIPASPIAYPVYQALKAASPALGAAFAAAEAGVIASLAVQGAAVLGAGAAGWLIGTAIRQQLGLNYEPPDLSSFVQGGTAGVRYLAKVTIYSEPSAPLDTEVFVRAPFAGPLRKTIGSDEDLFYFREAGTGTDVPIIDFGPSLNPRIRVLLREITKDDGSPAPELRGVPVYPQRKPFVPLKYPATIPSSPGVPAIPITPTVVPTPGNDPDEDNKQKEPGVTVQIPELGLQIQYSPSGVRIGAYRSPETLPFTPPKVPLPPNTTTAAGDPCPCPEEKSDNKEVICRIKTLQTEILNDGYDFTTTTIPEGVGGSATVTTGELVQANVFVTQAPLNVQRQAYRAIDSDVIFAGWFSWTREGRAGERLPLHFESNSFYPPKDADGFKYAFNNGVLGTGSIVTRVKRKYVDLCVNVPVIP